jgi:ornithine decarboxylase
MTVTARRTARPAPLEPVGGSTPYLVVDVDVAAAQYHRIAAAFAGSRVHYAVKANPEPPLLRALVEAGSRFDVAGPAEIDRCLAAGAGPSRLSYGNTIKKAGDIAYAYARGVRLFTFDSLAEVDKIAEQAPGATVLCRLLASSEGAQWPLSRKFGCTPELAADLLDHAGRRGLDPAGVCFHVGSQQLDPARWEPSIAVAAELFRCLPWLPLRLLNVGGGFPVDYCRPARPIGAYAVAIEAAVARHFGGTRPDLMIEPGRYVAAPAGVLHTEVVLVARKSYGDDHRWVYLDVGRFGGLAETEDEAIRYRLSTPHDGLPDGPVVLAGPTCDSVDILYQRARYSLPLALRSGDVLRIHGTGAYTATYSSVGFNGMAPLRTICVGPRRGAGTG